MTNPIIQPSFSAGEISPELSARVDLEQYRISAAELTNMFVDYRGGVHNRPGTMIVGFDDGNQVPSCPPDPANSSFWRPALIPFIFSETEGYVIVVSDLKTKFIWQGGFIVNNGFAVNLIFLGLPTTIIATGHTYSNGDIVYFGGCAGTLEINGRYFRVTSAMANSFVLESLHSAPGSGDNVDSTGWGTYAGGGSVFQVYEIITPYDEADLQFLHYVQSADVVVITSPLYEPATLTRVGHDNWVYAAINFQPTISAPGSLTITSNLGAGTTEYSYQVTAVNGADASESRPGTVTDTTLAYWSGNLSNKVDWGTVSGAAFYNVYRATVTANRVVPGAGIHGFIGSSRGTAFNDQNLPADFTLTPPDQKDPFNATNNYPAAAAFFQQRLAYAGTFVQPTTVWFSNIGTYYNLDESLPARDTDAIVATISSLQVDPISAMLAMPLGLLTFSNGGVYQLSGETTGGPVTPRTISSQPVSTFGASSVKPVSVGNNVLYAQYRGTVIRHIAYNLIQQGYEAKDVTLLASHMFEDNPVQQLAFAEDPWVLVYAPRADGQMPVMAFDPDSNVYGWSRYETTGIYQSVCCIPEGGETAVYQVVWRPLNPDGYLNSTQYIPCIERISSRKVTSSRVDARFVDCGVATVPTFPDGTLFIIEIVPTIIAIFSSVTAFDSSYVGKLFIGGGGVGTATSFDSPFLIITMLEPLTEFNGERPRVLNEGTWSLSVKASTWVGLGHLEGQEVTGLADGIVIPPTEVVLGKITLSLATWPDGAGNVVIGLPYTSRLKTSRLEVTSRTMSTAQSKRKKISATTLRLYRSLGMEIGSTFETLTPYKHKATAIDPYLLVTDDYRRVMDPSWNEYGQVCVEQSQPYPMTVLGVIPEVEVGDD